MNKPNKFQILSMEAEFETATEIEPDMECTEDGSKMQAKKGVVQNLGMLEEQEVR